MEAPRTEGQRDPAGMEIREEARGSPPTIAMQPRPRLVRVVHFRLFGWWVTAVMRHWRGGDAGRCKLCRRCMAYEDGCLTVVRGRLTRGEAESLSIAGVEVQDDPDAGPG